LIVKTDTNAALLPFLSITEKKKTYAWLLTDTNGCEYWPTCRALAATPTVVTVTIVTKYL